MSPAPYKPPASSPDLAKARFGWRNIAAIAFVCVLGIGFGLGIWQLGPQQVPIGRPIGSAGQVQAFAVPASPTGEGFTIWRGKRQIFALPQTQSRTYERIELSSNDVDIAGSRAPDLVLYTWTGGAHCCFTQILIDGQSGRLLGQFELGNGDPMPFIPVQTQGSSRAIQGSPRAVIVNFDDVSADKFGAYVDSPMARIVVAWNGKRFGLETVRMKASHADHPPAYFIAEPDLGDAVALGIADVGINDENNQTTSQAPMVAKIGGPRGDRTQAYVAWMQSEETRMASTTLNPNDLTSYGPMAAFLNERIYKGQAVSGVASVVAAHQTTPQARDIALNYYFDMLRKSRWFEDLNTLNDGKLTTLTATRAISVEKSP